MQKLILYGKKYVELRHIWYIRMLEIFQWIRDPKETFLGNLKSILKKLTVDLSFSKISPTLPETKFYKPSIPFLGKYFI